MILIYGDEKAWAMLPEAEQGRIYGEYMEYSKKLAAAGVLKGGASLKEIATASCVKVRSGKAVTTDGPFAETKEQLGGYYLIEVPDLTAALKYAAQCPGANYGGTCEVRPLGVITDPAGGITAMQ
jgi:hypothetical protein